MALLLRPVPIASGPRWLGDALRLYRRRPLALTLMLAIYLLTMVVLTQLPWLLGLPLLFMSPPLLSLGLMIAAQSALLDGPVHPRQYLEPLRGPAPRRRALLLLCLLYGGCIALVTALCFGLAGDTLRQLGALGAGAGDQQRMAELLAEPDMRNAVTLFNVLVAVLSVPFWHAPALVHWGAQGVGQALFSSTLAVWRAKGAFLAYGLCWAGASTLAFMLASVLLVTLGGTALGPIVATGVVLVMLTVFYVSVLFTFNDSFGGTGDRPVDMPGDGTSAR